MYKLLRVDCGIFDVDAGGVLFGNAKEKKKLSLENRLLKLMPEKFTN